jgi:ABC-type phosphate transport system permease subunit
MIVNTTIGIFLGFLVGIPSSIVVIVSFKFFAKENNLKKISTALAELLSLPSFWFGGPWVGTKILKNIDWGLIIPYYLISLSVVFFVIVAIPLYRLVIRVSNEIKAK